MTTPKIVSIYSGGGGLDLGFKRAGFEVTFSSDHWDKACETLKLNFPSTEVFCGDIKQVDFESILEKNKGQIDVLIGGPPCPPFSKSRFYRKEKKRGIEDVRGEHTLREYFRGVEVLSPTVFFFENVHGFVYRPHQAAFDYLKLRATELGYRISWQVVNTADYGVPQTRERFICIGVKNSLPFFEFPQPTHYNPAKNDQTENRIPWVNCGQAIGDLDFDLPEDAQMQAGSKHKELLKLVPPGDNYLYFTEKRGYPNPIFKWRSRYWSFLLKLSPDRPSWTIQASHSNNMGPFHWKNRFLRILEIKRIQTFPDDFELTGNFREKWRQIGNAVPPLLAEIVAKEIKRQYFENENPPLMKQPKQCQTSTKQN